MEMLNLHHAKAQLSRLVEQAAAGKEIVIAKAGRPMARLTSFNHDDTPRPLGLLKGKIWIADDFDDAPTMTDEEIRAWEDKEL